MRPDKIKSRKKWARDHESRVDKPKKKYNRKKENKHWKESVFFDEYVSD